MITASSSMIYCVLFILCFHSCRSTSQEQTKQLEIENAQGIISFLSTRDGNFEIYTMTADGSNVKNLEQQ
jgi:TolB protein